MNELSSTMPETHRRKTINELKTEYDLDRKMYNKNYVHTKSGENYQLLFSAFDEATNEKVAIYVLSSMPWMKFCRPFEEFKTKFHEMGSLLS